MFAASETGNFWVRRVWTRYLSYGWGFPLEGGPAWDGKFGHMAGYRKSLKK